MMGCCSKSKGFTLIEMLIYIALLTIFTLLIVTTIVSFSKSLRALKVSRSITSSASIAMERMTRELRTSTDIDLVESVLGANPGRIRLVTTNEDGYLQNISFILQDGIVSVYENDILSGPLTSLYASTTNLVFRLLDNGKTKAVKIEMTIQAQSGPYSRTENFYSTVILRNSL